MRFWRGLERLPCSPQKAFDAQFLVNLKPIVSVDAEGKSLLFGKAFSVRANKDVTGMDPLYVVEISPVVSLNSGPGALSAVTMQE